MISVSIDVNVNTGMSARERSDAGQQQTLTVNLEPEGPNFRFMNLKVGQEPTIPILQDKPPSRRLLQALTGLASEAEPPASLRVTVGQEPTVVVAVDKPVPRRLVQLLVEAAKQKMAAEREAKVGSRKTHAKTTA